jgi:hypothetical protein
MTISELMSSIRALPPAEQMRLFHQLEELLYAEAPPLALGDSPEAALLDLMTIEAEPGNAHGRQIEGVRERVHPLWNLLEMATAPAPVLNLHLKWLRKMGF